MFFLVQFFFKKTELKKKLNNSKYQSWKKSLKTCVKKNAEANSSKLYVLVFCDDMLVSSFKIKIII